MALLAAPFTVTTPLPLLSTIRLPRGLVTVIGPLPVVVMVLLLLPITFTTPDPSLSKVILALLLISTVTLWLAGTSASMKNGPSPMVVMILPLAALAMVTRLGLRFTIFSSVTFPVRLLTVVGPSPVKVTATPEGIFVTFTAPVPSLSTVADCVAVRLARSMVCGPLPVQLTVLPLCTLLTEMRPVPRLMVLILLSGCVMVKGPAPLLVTLLPLFTSLTVS